MSDHDIDEELVSFLVNVMEHSQNTPSSICFNSKLSYKNKQLVFMIDGLYQHLVSLNNLSVVGLSYNDFRRLLYAGNINTRLAEKGYVISVSPSNNDTRNKVDANWYQLTSIPS
jgi:hypothetical protein